MTTNIEIIEPKIFAHTVAEEIRFLIDEAVAARGRCLIALAGGKTPAGIYRTLALPPLLEAIPWDKVVFFLGDERWVDHEDPQSNYHMVRETLLGKLTKLKPSVYPVNTALKSPSEGARDYELTIKKIAGCSADKIPELDLVVLGVGEDGHTASLFPGSPALKSDNTICEGVTVDETIKKRVTITFPLIVEARRILFVVCGKNKVDILKDIIESDNDEFTYPAAIYKKAKGKVSWFVDSAAAAKLSS